jgi:hypothetical protein
VAKTAAAEDAWKLAPHTPITTNRSCMACSAAASDWKDTTAPDCNGGAPSRYTETAHETNEVMTRYAFLLGSQRSGTTILSRCLDLHPDIAHFYEPYYLWDRLIDGRPDDVPDPANFTPAFERDIRVNYARFARKSGKRFILDKSPQHCYKVPYVHRVFPDARWIHLVRDGRAVALSTHKEWLVRRDLAQHRDFALFRGLIRRSFSLQPFWYFRLRLLWYWLPRLGGPRSWLQINRAKWGGHIGWGSRFPGWQTRLESGSLLEFNARQWSEAIRHASDGLSAVPGEQVLTVRYETFVDDPRECLRGICAFLDLDCPARFLDALPAISAEPARKWQNELSVEQLRPLAPLLDDVLHALGYTPIGR